jgi:VanZ family protein
MMRERPGATRPTRPAASPRRAWLLAAAWTVLIEVATSVPGPSLPPTPAGGDKVAHLLVFLVLGLLSARALAAGRHRDRPLAWVVLVAAVVAFGALDEVHQAFVPQRTPDVLDFVADAVGGAIGVALASAVLRRRPRPAG